MNTRIISRALLGLVSFALVVGGLIAMPSQLANADPGSGGDVVGWGDIYKSAVGVPVQSVSAGHASTALVLTKEGKVVHLWGDEDDAAEVKVPSGLTNIKAVAAGSYHFLALKSDGTVVAWGSNENKQAKPPKGLKSVAAISAGSHFSVALKTNGTVVAWGDVPPVCDGEDDDCPGDDSGSADSVPSGLRDVAAISAGEYHVLALKKDGTVVGWGTAGTDADSGQDRVPDGLTSVTAVAAGEYHSLALKSDGTVVAWGSNDDGQCDVPAGLNDVVAISAGRDSSWALKSDGTVVAWGNARAPIGLAGVVGISVGMNGYAWRADGSLVNLEGSGEPPASLSGATAIAAGNGFSLAVMPDGTVRAWGHDSYTGGQTTVPAGLGNVVGVAAGDSHALAVKSDGTVVGWGTDFYGETTIPAGLTGVVAVGAGERFSVALKSDGTVVAWGNNGSGRTAVPAGLSGVTTISVSDYHTLALKADGTVVAWGDGDGPEVPSGLTDVVAIAAGCDYYDTWSLAVKSDGTVVAWGGNQYKQTSIPKNLRDVVNVAAGSRHALALKSDGTVVAWGDGTQSQTSVPRGLSDVSLLAAGENQSLAVGVVNTPGFTKVGTAKISGTAKVGKTLKVSSKGSWSPAPLSYSYQWTRGGADIAGATSASYTLTADDYGQQVSVKVLASRYWWADTWSKPAKSVKVAAGSLTTKSVSVVNTTTGKSVSKYAPKFEDVLQASTATWSPAPVTLTYQWLRSGKAIAGATSDTYQVQAVDVGKKLSVKVTGNKTGYKSASKTSSKTKTVVGKAFVSAPVPTFWGDPKVGETLTVNVGGWSPAVDSLSFQWYRNGSKIKGATGASYRASSKDAGKSLTVKVTGKKAGYKTTVKTSAKLKIK
ncbi:MAG: hypothetical protein LBR58_02200 [Propionibacteriaceae bacterium]|jgi:alpha-tubulin suppressor-like RCC1 family protein|nr:hypothetical protein [Propionibacteriaceae bacterium]